MTRMFFEAENCRGATSELTGRNYNADKKGFIHVDDPKDAKFLQTAGYLAVGGMPKLRKYWLCKCGWEATINSCPKCKSTTSLRKVEK